jgi:hypothetical protein
MIDSDEIDAALGELVEYLDAYGVQPQQIYRLLHERVAIACEILDAEIERINEITYH